MKFDWNLIKRACVFWWQRRTRGFDDSETWSMDQTLSIHILPRLKRFKQVNNGTPYGLTEEQWNEILDKMIYSFEFASNEDKYFYSHKQWEYDKFKEGIKLFAKYFSALWW